MADVNYVNPGSIRPEYDWKPQGALAGMLYQKDRQRYDNVAGLQDATSMQSLRKSQAEFQEYLANAPFRRAEQEHKQGMFPLLQNQMRGTNQTTDLANQFNTGTLQSRMDELKGKNTQEATSRQMENLQQGLAIATVMAKASANPSPATTGNIMNALRSSGIDTNHPVLKAILSDGDPRKINQRATQLAQALNQANQQYRTAMDQQKMQSDTAIRVGAGHDAASRYATDHRAAAKNKDANSFLDELSKKPAAVQLQGLAGLLADPELEIRIKTRAKAMYEQALVTAQALARPREGAIPGLPTQVPQNFDPSKQGSSTNTGIPGVTRID